MDPANEWGYQAEPLRCHACATRDRAARKTEAGFDDAGVRWITTKKE